MTLMGAILRKVQSKDDVKDNAYVSPPPEVQLTKLRHKIKKRIHMYNHIKPSVDTSPPNYDARRILRYLPAWSRRSQDIYIENAKLLQSITTAYMKGGKVDSRWRKAPILNKQRYTIRQNSYKTIERENKDIYKRIVTTRPRLTPTSVLQKEWELVKNEMVQMSGKKFVLFPVIKEDVMEDPAFVAPKGFRRPKVHITLRIGGTSTQSTFSSLGTLAVELFTDVCPHTSDLFLELAHGDTGFGYIGTRMFRRASRMLVSDSGLSGNDICVKIVSPEGHTFTAYFGEDTLIEEVKNKAIDHFYPTGETGAGRFKVVRVCDTSTLHDFLTLGQAEVVTYEELLLIERRIPEAGTLWDLGTVRAPQHSAITAATAFLPTPQNATRQPNLQSLLSTNELSFELRKILISLIEAGAKLAAAGRNYETTIEQLCDALDEPQRTQEVVAEVITPEEIASRFNMQRSPKTEDTAAPSTRNEECKRAEHLQRFFDKFRAWRMKLAPPPSPEAVDALKDLGFKHEEVDTALRSTGSNVPAAASWLIGERGSSVFELINGLPEGLILETLLKQPQIQRGLLNTRMLLAFIAMVGQTGSAGLWLNSPHGSPLLSQISRTYHSEKYCLAVNQFSQRQEQSSKPSTSRQRN